jgi:hypothetical protein
MSDFNFKLICQHFFLFIFSDVHCAMTSGSLNKDTAPTDSPYFEEFFDLLDNLKDPVMTDPMAWLWICGDRAVEAQVRTFLKGSEYEKTFF